MPRPSALPIWLDLSGGYDESLPAWHPRYPQHRSPDLLNVVVRDGVNMKWPGRVAYGPGNDISGGSKLLCDFAKSDGTHYLVISNGYDFWYYTGSAWTRISPSYSTGTVGKPADSAVVTGSGTAWQTWGAKPGDGLDVIVDGVPVGTTIASVDSETQLTLTSSVVQEYPAASSYIIWSRLSAGGVDWLRAVVANDILYVLNGTDPPLQWTGTGSMTFMPASAGSAVPVARFASTFHMRNLLVMANIASYPRRLQNSAANDYTEWTDVTKLAASYDFTTMGGEITGIDGGHEFLFVFFPDGIWRGFWSGTDVQMEWAQVPSTDGCWVPNSLLRLGAQGQTLEEGGLTRWAYMGEGNFYAFDGERVTPIGDPIRRWVFEHYDTNYADRVRGVVAPEWHLAIWSFPTRGSSGVNTRSVAFDYQSGEWFPADIAYACLGRFVLDAGDTEQWDSLVGSVDAQSRRFDDIGSTPEPLTVAADGGGRVYYLDFGTLTDKGTAIRARRRTPTAQPAGDDAVDLAQAVAQTQAPGASVTVDFYAADGGDELGDPESHVVTAGRGGEARAYSSKTGKCIALEVANGNAGEQLGLTSVTPYVIRRGR